MCILFNPLSPCWVHRQRSVRVRLLKLTNGKPHSRAKNPFLECDIPLTPTEPDWELGLVVWENELGCLSTSRIGGYFGCVELDQWGSSVGEGCSPSPFFSAFTFHVAVLPQCGNRSFRFLNENTIVVDRTTENARPSLSSFDRSSEDRPIAPYLMLVLSDEG